MRHLLMTIVVLFIAVATSANSAVQQPLYIINGKVVTIDVVKQLGNDLESMTVLKNKRDIKAFEHLGDTSNGVIVITLKDAEEEDMPFICADVMPQFMGGDIVAFREWVMQNIRYPKNTILQDDVVAQFVVDRHGYVDYDKIRILKSDYPDIFGEEVKRVISSSPRWTPAFNNGYAVSHVLTLPVTFRLANSDSIKFSGEVDGNILVMSFGPETSKVSDKHPIYIIDGAPATPEEVRELSVEDIKDVTFSKQADMYSYYKDYGNIENGLVIIRTNSLDPDIENNPDTLPIFMETSTEAFNNWFYEILRYPEQLRDKNLAAHYVVKFKVDSAGYVAIMEIECIKGTAHKLFEDEITRIMLSSPRWTPGVKNGKAVSCRLSLPVIFGSMDI